MFSMLQSYFKISICDNDFSLFFRCFSVFLISLFTFGLFCFLLSINYFALASFLFCSINCLLYTYISLKKLDLFPSFNFHLPFSLDVFVVLFLTIPVLTFISPIVLLIRSLK